MYENPWLFNGVPYDSPDKFAGFVYLITNKLDGRRYIGRKYFWSIRKQKGKKRRQRSESDWREYYGSSQELLADIEKLGEENFERRILSLHTTRGDVNYEEVRQQFLLGVLESDEWYNEAIGKYRRKPQHIVEGRRYSS